MEAKWKAYTSDGSSPREKPRVYYTGHPDDLDEYWEEISQDIWKFQKNCAIYRLDTSEGETDWEELRRELEQMQLLVIPVTQSFLDRKNRARERELPFALERKIPVLPLLQEAGLEGSFNRKCAGLQLLYKEDPDPTVRPYEEKLRERLSGVLVDDEERENVKNSFDGKIFLSYRKKDRWYARRLMELIHRQERFQGVSIWYDEFLTPGERFDEEIHRAIRESDLFLLNVTENILEPNNYVKEEEYKAAREAEKPILPVEMKKLRKEKAAELLDSFPGLPSRMETGDGTELGNGLYRALAAGLGSGEKKRGREGAAPPGLREYYIGLAYLNGICMEVDRERGVRYVTRAAERGTLQALRKLMMMYWLGDGVERNIETAIRWGARLTKAYEELGERAHVDVRLYLAAAHSILGIMYSELPGEGQRAGENTEKALRLFEELDELRKLPEAVKGVTESYRQAGRQYRDQKEWEKAEKCYQKALDLVEGQGAEEKQADLYYDLGYLAFFRGQEEKAREYGEKSLNQYDGMLQRGDRSLSILRGTANALSLLADLCGAGEERDRAEELLREGLDLREEALEREKEDRELMVELVFDYNKLSGILLGALDAVADKISEWLLNPNSGSPGPDEVEKSRKCIARAETLNRTLSQGGRLSQKEQEGGADTQYVMGICGLVNLAVMGLLAERGGLDKPGSLDWGKAEPFKQAKDSFEEAIRWYRGLGGEGPRQKCLESYKSLCVICRLEELLGIEEKDEARKKDYYVGKGWELCRSLRGPDRQAMERSFAAFLSGIKA